MDSRFQTKKLSKTLPDKMSHLWVVLPGFNEENHIERILKHVKRFAKNVVFIDDGSSDNSFKVATTSGVHVLKHISNLGKGAALRTGCDYAIQEGATQIIVMDSDGQHDPEEIIKFKVALDNGADIVFGCRTWNSQMPFVMKAGNVFFKKAISSLYGISIEDTQSGYRAFTAKAYQKIRWNSNDYSMESEMIIRTKKANLKLKSVRIKTIYLDEYKGTTIFNGLRIGINLLFWRLFGLSKQN